MIVDLVRELENAGFRVDNHSGIIDGCPLYVIDLYGHPKQKAQIRIISKDWFNFREEAREAISNIRGKRGKISL